MGNSFYEVCYFVDEDISFHYFKNFQDAYNAFAAYNEYHGINVPKSSKVWEEIVTFDESVLVGHCSIRRIYFED